MRIFVTGATGCIGTELAKELMEAGHVRTESDPPAISPATPRQPEQIAKAATERGVRVAIVRLPQVHDTRKQGLVPLLTQLAREKGVSAYVGNGANRWAAAPPKDVAHLYRLALEQTGSDATVYHAVQEEGVALREIAEALGRGHRCQRFRSIRRTLPSILGGLRTSRDWICQLRASGRARRWDGTRSDPD